MKRALCIGINAYPSSPLRGCLNDVVDMRRLLNARGYAVETLLDGQATCQAIVSAINFQLRVMRESDSLVISYSGHGTWVRDLNGDEPDAKDECLVPFDFEWNDRATWITDDLLHDLVQAAKLPPCRVLFVLDSCHSGTGTRAAFSKLAMVGEQVTITRFRHLEVPASFLAPPVHFFRRWAAGLREKRIGERVVQAPTKALVGLLSATTPKQLAADAYLNGDYHGAHTFALAQLANGTDPLRALRSRMAQWMRQHDFDQTPTLYGAKPLRALPVFA